MKQNIQYKDAIDKIVIVTTTLYNPDSEIDLIRAGFAKKTIQKAAEYGYSILVDDAGSGDEFLKELEKYCADINSVELSSMGKDRRGVIERAGKLEKDIIAWTEPEKYPYIENIGKTAVPIIEGSADIVVPGRVSSDSYPVFQQYTEKVGNMFWLELTGQDLDVWFGPRTWGKDNSHYFLDYDGEYGDMWDSIFIPVMDMIKDGKKVKRVNVDYKHPEEQTACEKNSIELHSKRIRQLSELTCTLKKNWEK